jgi:hypothetical protein
MAGLPPDEVARLLTERAEHLRRELRALEASLAVSAEIELPDIFLVESHYRRTMLTAELEFVATLAKEIRSSSFSGTKTWRRLHELRESGMSFEQIMSDPVLHLGEEGRYLVPQQDRE